MDIFVHSCTMLLSYIICVRIDGYSTYPGTELQTHFGGIAPIDMIGTQQGQQKSTKIWSLSPYSPYSGGAQLAFDPFDPFDPLCHVDLFEGPVHSTCLK